MICAAANPAMDATLVLDRLVPGAIHRPREVSRRPGGKAINVARATLALAAEASVVALVAAEAAEWFGVELEAEGIPFKGLAVPGGMRCCTSILDAAAGELTEVYEDGAEVDDTGWDRFARAVLGDAGEGATVVLSGSLPRGVDPSALGRLAAAIVASGASLAVDASGAALAATSGTAIDLVKVNEAEARDLLGAGHEERSAAQLATTLRERFEPSLTTAIVTLGPRGAVAASPSGGVLTATLDRPPGHFPVGSGDVFLAGLLVAGERGQDLGGRLRLATGAGAANAERIGAGTLDPALAENLASAVRIEEQA